MEPEKINDMDILLGLLASGNSERLQQEAFEKLFLFFWKPLKRYAEQRVDDKDIDDLLQDVFSGLWLHRKELISEKIKSKKDLEKWLMDSVRSKAANIRRQQMKRVEMDDEDYNREISDKTALAAEQVDFVERKEYEEKMQEIIDKLPPDLRLIYSLKRNHGYSIKLIASYMKLTEIQVKERFRKAKDIIEKRMLEIYRFGR